LFRPEPERTNETILREALSTAVAHLAEDLDLTRRALTLADQQLAGLYASSRAPDAWALLVGLGPLTRAELARALEVTKRTASQAAVALEKAELVQMRASDRALTNSIDIRVI
jgi:CRP-like cAMP-binding protein